MQMNTEDWDVDIVIVGAGPIGMACAIEAIKNKMSYIIVEKGTLVNSLYHFPTNMTFFSTSKLLEIGEVPFVSHSEKPTRREALEYYRRVYDSWKMNVLFYEEVLDIKKENQQFKVKTSKRQIKGRYVIVSTGFYGLPNLMNIPGESLPKVRHYYQEAHPYIGQEIVVVGAANSACDVALELYHKGSNVTMVVRGNEINNRVKYWIRPNIDNRIKEGSIRAFFQSKLIEIKEDFVVIQTPDGIKKINNDYVLAMTGYQPDLVFLERIGLSVDQSSDQLFLVDPNTLETSIKDLYLAGVIVAGVNTSKLFIENTRVHASIILANILKKEKLAMH